MTTKAELFKAMKKPSKYRNVKTEYNGILFHSKREKNRYQELVLLEKVKQIRDIRLQVRYDLDVNGVRIAFYKADFVYWDLIEKREVVEDCKGYPNEKYPMKKKLMKALHGIEILET